MEISESVIRLALRGDWVFWLSFLQLSWFLRWVCYLHFTSNDGFNGFQQIHEDLQIGAAVQENLFTMEVSRLCVWIFVACYTAAPKLASLQDFVFVPGYALCAPAHLSEIGKMFHYAFVVICFLLIPLLTAIFSYIKIAKTIQQHNADVNYNPETRNIQSHYYACDQDKQITFRSCASLLHSRFWCRHATPLPIKMGAEL